MAVLVRLLSIREESFNLRYPDWSKNLQQNIKTLEGKKDLDIF